MECPNCKAQVSDTAKFCESCGKELPAYRFAWAVPKTAEEANVELRRRASSFRNTGIVLIIAGVVWVLAVIPIASAIANEPIPQSGGQLLAEPCTWADGSPILVAQGNCERVRAVLGTSWVGWLLFVVGLIFTFLAEILRRVRAVPR